MWPIIVHGLRKQGLEIGDLTAIILTHRHKDHADNAIRFQNAGVPIYAHKNDADIMAGRTMPPVLNGRAGPVAWMSTLENRRPVRLDNVEPLKDHDKIAGFNIFHCPGHTTGSIFIWHEQSGSIFTGDGLLNALPPYVQKTQLSLPFPDFCDNHKQSLKSLQCFLDLGLNIKKLFPGHGPVREGPVYEDLKALLANE